MSDQQLLGQGIYDLVEVARLVQRSVDEVAGWATRGGAKKPLLLARDRRLLSFFDLVTAVVTAELRRREVPLRRIRVARDILGNKSGLDWPLAHYASLRRLASVGRDVYVRDADEQWVDAGRHGQRAFPAVIKPLLNRIDFDEPSGMAALWRPVRGVVVNPQVQAGAPCVEGTRVATELLAELVEAGESLDDVARDYGLELQKVRAALKFEHALAA